MPSLAPNSPLLPREADKNLPIRPKQPIPSASEMVQHPVGPVPGRHGIHYIAGTLSITEDWRQLLYALDILWYDYQAFLIDLSLYQIRDFLSFMKLPMDIIFRALASH